MIFSLFLRTDSNDQSLPVEDYANPEAVVEMARHQGLLYEGSEIQYADDCVFFYFADLSLGVKYTLVCEGSDAKRLYPGRIETAWAPLELAEETYDEIFVTELLSEDDLESDEIEEEFSTVYKEKQFMAYNADEAVTYYKFEAVQKSEKIMELYSAGTLTWEHIAHDIDELVMGNFHREGNFIESDVPLYKFLREIEGRNFEPESYGDGIFSWIDKETGASVEYVVTDIFSEIIVNAFFNTLHLPGMNQKIFQPSILLPTSNWMKGVVLRYALYSTGSSVAYSSSNAITLYDVWKNIANGDWKYVQNSPAKNDDTEIFMSFNAVALNATRGLWVKKGMLVKVLLSILYSYQVKEEDRESYINTKAISVNYAIATTLKNPEFYTDELLTQTQINYARNTQSYTAATSASSSIPWNTTATEVVVSEEKKSALRSAMAAGQKPETEEERVAKADMAIGKLMVLGDKAKEAVSKVEKFADRYPVRHKTSVDPLGKSNWVNTLPRWTFIFQKQGHTKEEWQHIDSMCCLNWTSHNNLMNDKTHFPRQNPHYMSAYSAEAKELFGGKVLGSPQSNTGIEIHNSSDFLVISVAFVDDLPDWALHLLSEKVNPMVWLWDSSTLRIYPSTPELTYNICNGKFKEYGIKGQGIAKTTVYPVTASKGYAKVRKEAAVEINQPGYIKSFLTFCSSKA